MDTRNQQFPNSISTAADKMATIENLLSNYAWIAGLFGAGTILFLTFFAAQHNTLARGWKIGSFIVTSRFTDSILFIVGACGMTMFICELIVRCVICGPIISFSPKLRDNKYIAFFLECLIEFTFNVFILYFVLLFYKFSNEYGYLQRNSYYLPWFRLSNLLWEGYLFLGLPYILLTRSLQYSAIDDKREPSYILIIYLLKIVLLIKHVILKKDISIQFFRSCFNTIYLKEEKAIILGVLIKAFFIPLMTVFFADQCLNLIEYWKVFISWFSNYEQLNFQTIYRFIISALFCVDVGLAWCGYVISSRWIKNKNVSVEPTVLGWGVTLCCYPPFQQLLNIHFTVPTETGFLTIPNSVFVYLTGFLSIASYFVYVFATICFGLRFSNLTHRGIIKKGPYAIIRHPAYAAKNLSWWLIMFPYSIWASLSNNPNSKLTSVIALLIMTYLYYLRALTEEKHLSVDAEYRQYCKAVPYRFIPGIY